MQRSLNSYDPTEALNAAILENASSSRVGGTKTVFCFISGTPPLNPSPVLYSGGKTTSELGVLAVQKLSSNSPDAYVLQRQIFNRHGIDWNNKNQQLILLDDNDAQVIKGALAQEVAFTRGSNACGGVGSIFGLTDPDAIKAVEYLMVNRKLYIAQKRSTSFSGSILSALTILMTKEPLKYAELTDWLGSDIDKKGKFYLHDYKSGNRLSTHFKNIHDSNARNYSAEARGEFASSKMLITVLGNNYQLKVGKASSGRVNGIDQIWVKRNLETGKVEEYLIVESKGSAGAGFSDANYGKQMSPRWVFYCLLSMMGDDGRLASDHSVDQYAKKDVVNKMLLSMLNPDYGPRVKGVVIQAMTGSSTDAKSIEMNNLGYYDLSYAYDMAKNEHSVFDNALFNNGPLL